MRTVADKIEETRAAVNTNTTEREFLLRTMATKTEEATAAVNANTTEHAGLLRTIAENIEETNDELRELTRAIRELALQLTNTQGPRSRAAQAARAAREADSGTDSQAPSPESRPVVG